MVCNSYLHRHWRGQLPLFVSYWINHVLLGSAAWFMIRGCVAAVQRQTGEQPFACLCFAAAIFVIWIGVQTWLIRGTWRSAARARLYGRPVRATIVQTVLSFSILSTALLPVGTLLPMALALGTGRPVPVPGTIARDDGRIIDFTGPINKASADAFRQVLAGSNASIVRLDSLGGLVSEARAIAAAIRSRGLDTQVTGRCASACTIVFFAGHHRTLLGDGKLGFHSYSSMAVTPQALVAQEEWERRVYLAGGVTSGFVDHIYSIPPAEIWYPTRAEAEAAGFATKPAASSGH